MTVQITPFNAFDARKDFDIVFRTTGNQTVRHTLTVYNNISGVKVYTAEVASYKQAHTIPAGKLTNGTEYYCIIVVYDGNGESAESAPV